MKRLLLILCLLATSLSAQVASLPSNADWKPTGAAMGYYMPNDRYYVLPVNASGALMVDAGTGMMLIDGSNAADLVDLPNRVRAAFASITSDLDVAGVAKFADGTAAAPSITFGSDPDTGIYRYGANELGFSCRLFTKAAATSSEVSNGLSLWQEGSGDGTGTSVRMGYGTTPGAYSEISGLYAGAPTTGTFLDLSTSGSSTATATTKLRVTPTGNVLIGTTADDGVTKLQVNGDGVFVENILHYTGTAQKAGTKKGGTSFLSAGGYMVTEIGASDYYTCGDLVVTSTTAVHIAKISLVGSVVVLDSYRGNTTATKDTASSVNIYVENGFINIQNNTAIPISISYVFQGTWTE